MRVKWSVHRIGPDPDFICNGKYGDEPASTAQEAIKRLVKKYASLMQPGLYVLTPVGGCEDWDRRPVVFRIEKPAPVITEVVD